MSCEEGSHSLPNNTASDAGRNKGKTMYRAAVKKLANARNYTLQAYKYSF